MIKLINLLSCIKWKLIEDTQLIKTLKKNWKARIFYMLHETDMMKIVCIFVFSFADTLEGIISQDIWSRSEKK